MTFAARREPSRRRARAAVAAGALVPLAALTLACLDGIAALAAGQLFAAAAGLR